MFMELIMRKKLVFHRGSRALKGAAEYNVGVGLFSSEVYSALLFAIYIVYRKYCLQKTWCHLKQCKYTGIFHVFSFSGIQDAKIVIATYGLLSKATSRVVLQALTNQKFQVVIVDESHYIRNIKTASCKAIGPLIRAANRRILLSGTPSLSKPVEVGY